jgi:hypothetical protein
VPHLASHVLALVARQLPGHWEAAYGARPLLLETLVDRPYSGTCYRAANWINVGQTQGRGRMDRYHEVNKTCKDILLYPLEPRWREGLCQVPPAEPNRALAEEVLSADTVRAKRPERSGDGGRAAALFDFGSEHSPDRRL